MKKLSLMLVVLVAVPSLGDVKFRAPLSLASTQCGGGRCRPSAYFDTNRSTTYRRDWACGTRTYNQHDGTDLAIGGFTAMAEGRSVLAAASGTVIAVHDGEFDRCTTGNCGTANYVKIRHACGKVSLYWHLKKWSIKVRYGQHVSCGALLGLAGSSGHSTGPHLHFGMVNTAGRTDDPYRATSSACGGPYGDWVSQGPYGGLPGGTCQ